jgi:predicted transcriptional regulator
VRVRLPAGLKERLERVAGGERRSPAAVVRRAIEREVERAESSSSREL